MKKVVAFLLVLFISVAPVTTFVKADVVIGDNDNIIMNENAYILGRKLAMLESLSDLALSGVTEFTISNTDDVDTYLDSLWAEINDAIDYLDSGEWVGDIPDKAASKYYTNLVNYRDVVNNRGEFLGFDLQNPATSLLKTYFANDTYGKKYTSTGLYQSLDMVRSLSNLSRNNPIPTPPIDYNIYINEINNTGFWFRNFEQQYISGSPIYTHFPLSDYSWYGGNGFGQYSSTSVTIFEMTEIIDINVFSVDDTYYVNIPVDVFGDAFNRYMTGANVRGYGGIINNTVNRIAGNSQYSQVSTPYRIFNYNDSGTLEHIIQNLSGKFRNCNIYVDGVAWSIVNNDSDNSPTIDIDGLLKIYGNDNPQQYELQPNTKIDYDQLYQVIYNAIRDNLPISQGDINYYDSHDTIYSPTIINNYGEEEGDESDLIDTILDYAVIPKFDTAIAQPMRQALTNGVVIMNNSITNVIPNEILLILGACFFLLLFAVVINRMIT